MCLCTWYWMLGWSTKKKCFSILPCWMWTYQVSAWTVYNIIVANFAMWKQNTDFTVIGWWCFCPLWLLLVLVVLFYNLLSYCCKRDIFHCMYFGNFYWCILYVLQFSVVNLSDIVKFLISIKLWIIKYRIDVSVNDSFCFYHSKHHLPFQTYFLFLLQSRKMCLWLMIIWTVSIKRTSCDHQSCFSWIIIWNVIPL